MPHSTCSGSSRITIEAHLEDVHALLAPVIDRLRSASVEYLSIDDPGLLGRVTGAALHNDHPLPPFDNSQMDGYAVRAADLASAGPEAPARLALGWTTAAGDAPAVHLPHTASPVMTGAAIPTGADAVVPIEAAHPPVFPALSRAGGPAPSGEVAFTAPVAPGTFVRAAGVDVAPGDLLLPAETRLTPARIGLLAASGIAAVPVRPRITILLCSTGDELADRPQRPAGPDASATDAPAAPLAAGRIHDANTPMLAALLRAAGARVRTLRAPDQPSALRTALEREAEGVDLVVTSGGISAGAFEVVRETLAPLGAVFRGLAMQPGGPQGLGLLTFENRHTSEPARTLPALCFPGNPVSAIISAEVFLLPTLRAYAGRQADRNRETRRLAHDTTSPADKHQVRRGRIESDGRVTLSPPGSHLIGDLAAADVLAHLPVGVSAAAENTEVETWRLDD